MYNMHERVCWGMRQFIMWGVRHIELYEDVCGNIGVCLDQTLFTETVGISRRSFAKDSGERQLGTVTVACGGNTECISFHAG